MHGPLQDFDEAAAYAYVMGMMMGMTAAPPRNIEQGPPRLFFKDTPVSPLESPEVRLQHVERCIHVLESDLNILRREAERLRGRSSDEPH